MLITWKTCYDDGIYIQCHLLYEEEKEKPHTLTGQQSVCHGDACRMPINILLHLQVCSLQMTAQTRPRRYKLHKRIPRRGVCVCVGNPNYNGT